MIAGYSDSVECITQTVAKIEGEMKDRSNNVIREEAQRRLVKEYVDKAKNDARMKGTCN